MDNKNINNIIKEIQTSENVAINLLHDIVKDFREICKKQRIVIVISMLVNLTFILYYIFNMI